jgi:hypothetical protein
MKSIIIIAIISIIIIISISIIVIKTHLSIYRSIVLARRMIISIFILIIFHLICSMKDFLVSDGFKYSVSSIRF